MILILIISTIISSLWVYFKEKLTGLIYEFDEINENIRLNCCLILDKKDLKLAPILFNNIISEEDIKNKKIAVINFEKDLNLDFLTKGIEMKFLKVVEFLDIDKNIDKYDAFIVVIKKGKVTKSDLVLLNKYLNVFKQKFKTWIYLDN